MLPAVYRRFAALNVEVWSPLARVMRATSVMDVDHTVLSMLPAVNPRLPTIGTKIEIRPLCAGVICATLCPDIYHAILSMLLAAHRHLDAFDIERRSLCAGFM